MSILQGAQQYELEDFRGSQQLLESSDASNAAARLSLNCEYIHGQVRPRDGFKYMLSVATLGTGIQSMAHWAAKALSIVSDILLYIHSGTTLRAVYMDNSSVYDVVTGLSSIAGFVAAPFGSRIYVVFLTSAGIGAIDPRVHKAPNVATSIAFDKAFRVAFGTFQISYPYTEPGAGVVTAGVHTYALLFYNEFGHPMPVNLDAIFDNYANSAFGAWQQGFFATAAGAMSGRVTITPTAGTWPTYLKTVQLVFSTVNNPRDMRLVPGVVTIPTGTATAVVLDINYSDQQLLANAESALKYQGMVQYLFGGSYGISPFGTTSYPHFVGTWNQRAFWIFNRDNLDGLLVSEVNDPEFGTFDQHLLHLPDGRRMVMGFVLRGVLYILGPGWTYAFSDNGGLPVGFPPSQFIDGRVGTLSPYGVAVNPSTGHAAVASQLGLYDFDGASYGTLPMSYLNTPDWELMDWASPLDVQVKDNAVKQLIIVRAKLRDATYVLMAWDYSAGRRFDLVNYSKWNFGTYNPGPIEMCMDPATNHWSLWVASRTGQKIMRQKSTLAGDAAATIWSDELDATPTTVAIDQQYQTAEFPPGSLRGALRHLAAEIRVLGIGIAVLTAKSLDSARSKALASITLGTTPGKRYTRDIGVQSEKCSLLMTNGNVVNSGFILSGLKWFYKRWISRRAA